MSQTHTSSAVAGTHGVLTMTEVSSETATTLAEQGFHFAVRSLQGPDVPIGSGLSNDEVGGLTKAGLAIMGLQSAGNDNPTLNGAIGRAQGQHAAAGAAAAGLSPGCTLWLDLDYVDPSNTAEDLIAYCNPWHLAVTKADYLPGIRVGGQCGLGSEMLYWRATTAAPEVDIRGYCALGADLGWEEIAGQNASRLVIQTDLQGNTPRWSQPISTSPDSASADVLLRLATEQGLAIPMQRMIAFANSQRPNSQPRYCCVVDFNRHSAKPRLFLFDRLTEHVQEYLCAHGKGSEGPTDDGYASVFSNENGSGCSSLGIYLCSEIYHGLHGKSMRLDGLEATNSRARHRAIVMHGADYVSEDTIKSSGRIGRSLGCPALDYDHVEQVVDALTNGSLMNIWHKGLQ